MATLAIAAVLALSGCAILNPATPTPAPTQAPTPTRAPLSPVEKQYQYTEKLYAGIESYNLGIESMRRAQGLFNTSDYTNASQHMLTARVRMDTARVDFEAMADYASTPKERNLSEKWSQTAYYAALSYQNAHDAYVEYANESGRPQPNYIKYNYYVEQANHFNALAAESQKQADAIMSTITFFAATQQP